MTDSVRAAEGDTIVTPEPDPAPQRHRSTFVEPAPAPSPETVAGSAADDQEHHPVTPTLTPEAPVDREPVVDQPVADQSSVPARAPRPASVPSHRADVPVSDVVPTHPSEPRPMSVGRHSLATSSIVLPVFAEPVDPSLPQPPERVTLDDDVLVRMVERRLDDTATVDLMAVLQAQLVARRQEAVRFARWADEVGRIGTDEAVEALERTRLRFTGVIDVVLPLPEPSTGAAVATAPSSRPATPEEAPSGSSAPVADPSPRVASSPAPASSPPAAASVPAAAVPAAVEPRADVATPAAPLVRAPQRVSPSLVPSSTVARVAVGAGLLVVLAAVVLAVVDADLLASAVVATVAAPVVGGLVGTGALRVVDSRRPGDAVVASRGPVAVVAAVVLAAVVGTGLLSPTASALAWEGWMVPGAGLAPLAGVLLALVASALVAFVVVVAALRVAVPSDRPSARD